MSNTNDSTTLTGHAAIEYAEANDLALSKYSDPTEDARDGLTVEEAREIAAEDPSLVYVTTDAWSFEDYWNTVLGPHHTPADVVREFDLSGDRRSVDEWLGTAESEACAVCGIDTDALDWDDHHEKALDLICEVIEAGDEPDPDDLVLCESPDGWSLHAPGSTDEDIASGDAEYLASGEGEPTASDYRKALAELGKRAAAVIGDYYTDADLRADLVAAAKAHPVEGHELSAACLAHGDDEAGPGIETIANAEQALLDA